MFYLREEQPILISLPWIQDLLEAALLQEHICRCSTTILCHVVVRFLWTWSGTLLQLFMSSKQQDSLVHSNSISAITTEGLCPSLFTNDSLTIDGYGTTALQWEIHDFNLAHLDGWRNYALTDKQRIIRIICYMLPLICPSRCAGHDTSHIILVFSAGQLHNQSVETEDMVGNVLMIADPSVSVRLR